MTLIGHAGLAYEQGRFWDSYWEELALEADDEFEHVLRHSLNDLLRKFRLREFPEIAASNYIRVMAMHAGIPVYCLGDLVEVIEEHVQHGRDTTGAAVLEWLTEPGMSYRLNRLDVPVRNFLQLAGEIAVDILDRIIEFLLFTVEHSDVWNDLALDTSTTGLPTLLLEGLIERLRERPFGQAAVAAPKVARRRKPAVSYSVEDDQVMVGVPYPTESPESPWKVSIAGTTREIYAERGWGVDDGAEHPHTPIAVTAPAREVLMVHDASGENFRIPVVDSADPLLLFTENGRLIQRHTALPRGLVLAVYPKDGTVADAVSGESIEFEEEARTPSGWKGWHAQFLDLAGHNSILFRRAGRPDGAIRGGGRWGRRGSSQANPCTASGLPMGFPSTLSVPRSCCRRTSVPNPRRGGSAFAGPATAAGWPIPNGTPTPKRRHSTRSTVSRPGCWVRTKSGSAARWARTSGTRCSWPKASRSTTVSRSAGPPPVVSRRAHRDRL
ncbi:hypothetical protein GS528_16320 [Rhodococcus hoagii]|nr:hypothetical protein [Prescottella equi]